VSELNGLFDVNREAWLVEPGDSYKISVSMLRRDPPPKHHPTRTRHREPIAIPRGLGGVAGHGAVRAVVGDELFKVGEETH
jgi:hypothetical protein